ncbi:MAG TPA: saccharopine dehydrogenase C-terminal domain-containing protein [Fimbriimonadaceae bacterium]|nr:saccharopine dehydrogenase C-terminal domain-containing protein [Fimbriimonadaceae bacterium]
MKKTFAILGAGMQGTAVAYDLAKHADPEHILMGDMDLEQAERNASRVNSLLDRNVCRAHTADALDPESLHKFLEPVDVVVSCVPYWMHPRVAAVAVKAGTHMCDMGGDTAVTWETLKHDEEAKAAGVTIAPDTGLAPGLVNNLAAFFMESLDETETIKLYCGGLPQHPKPPLNYKLVFNIEGLVTEYSHRADVIRNRMVVQVDTLDEVENIHVDGLGEMEAFTTSGGASTAPFTFEGEVDTYEYKTIRFPGHCAMMRMFRDYGFWDETPVKTRSGDVVPLHLFHKLLGEALRDPSDKDLIAVRGAGIGTRNGKRMKMQIDILEKHDDATGFTAMERMTGFSTAIYADQIGKGNMATGALRYETAMPGKVYVAELEKRGIRLKFSEEELA